MSRHWQYINNKRQVYMRRWTHKMQRALKDQAAPVIEALGNRDPDQVLDAIGMIMTDAPIRDSFRKLYPDVGVAFAREELKQQDPMIDIWSEEMTRYAETEAGTRIKPITGTSRILAEKTLRRLMLEEVIEQGMGIEDIAKLFQRRFIEEYGKYDLWRARRIAQTEVITASNKGNHMAATMLGGRKKVWLTGGAPQTIRHQGYPGLNGQERSIDEPFDVGGYAAQFPGDPDLPPEECINCHCATIYPTR